MITSVANRSIKAVRKLGKRPWRERQGSLLCEGHRALRSALDAGATVRQVLCLGRARERRADLLDRAKATGAEVLIVSEPVMRHLVPLASPPDMLAVVVKREQTLDEQVCDPAVVLLHQVRDPATVGAIIATAAAAGCSGAVQGQGTADPFDRKAIRAGAGAQLGMSIVRGAPSKDAIEHHRAGGAHVTALAPGAGPVWTAALSQRVLFVIDGGDAGAPDGVAALADEQVGPPPEVSVAAGATMLLYEWMRRRG